MRLLELFSGTKSVGKVADTLGYEVTSLDLKHADINTDILNWDYKTYEPKHFDVIWASPPCTEYSRALTTRTRNISSANQIVLKTLEIINYLKPKYYIIENPQTGLLKSQSFMDKIPFVDVDYCKYDMPYRKRTRLWNNGICFTPKPLCNKDCNYMNGNRHIGSCGCGGQGQGHKVRYTDKSYTVNDKYKIPSKLIEDIFNCIE